MSRALRRTYIVGGRAFEVAVRLEDGRLRGTVGNGESSREIDVEARRVDGALLRLGTGAGSVRATVVRVGDVAWVAIDGRTYELEVAEPGAGGAHHVGAEDFAVSPMTGVVTKVSVAAGDDVPEGAELFVVEAMKMEYVVKAPRALTVEDVRHGAGDAVDQGGVVITFAGTSA